MTHEIKIEMSKKDVQEALAEYVNREYGWVTVQHITADNVQIEVGTGYEDWPCGSSFPIFKKAVITVKNRNHMTDSVLASMEA